MIRYVTGDATDPVGDGPRLLCHICNDRGGWGKGFVLAVSRRWPDVREYYKRWVAAAGGRGELLLGKSQFIQVAPDLTVANMVAQHGYRATQAGPPIRYTALRDCLRAVREFVCDPRLPTGTVHMPRIGTGLAGGDWSEIEPMIEQVLEGVSVTVYDLPKRNR